MKSGNIIVVVSVILIAAVVLGEVFIYGFTSDRYDSDAQVEDGMLEYSISSTGSKEYAVIVFDNMDTLGVLYIYYDNDHGNAKNSDLDGVPTQYISQIEEVQTLLKYRGITNVELVNAESLGTKVSEDIASGSHSNGLLMLLGTLPDTVYSETNDNIFKWMDAGGRLYWAGSLIGKYYTTEDDVKEVENYQEKFFGAECLNTGDIDVAYSTVDNPFGDSPSFLNNHVKYGIDTSLVSGKSLAMGYEEDKYSSISMVEHGNGMICVAGGDNSRNLIKDLAQVIASNIGPTSEPIDIIHGTVKNSTSGTVDLAGTSGNISVYIFLGGDYAVYGKQYSFTV